MKDRQMLGTESYTIADRSSRGVDPERLRLLGKQASARHIEEGMNLSDAVVDVLRDEGGLNPEHVRRVAEFANNYAFEQEFTKSAAAHRVINFEGGPADSGRILQELRSGSDTGVGVAKTAGRKLHASERYIPGADGYRMRAGSLTKTASVASVDYPYVNPARELFELRELVKTAKEQMQARVISTQLAYEEAAAAMCKEAREIVLAGHSPVEVARVYSERSPHPVFTKLALKLASRSVTDVPAVQMSKEASARVINPAHPLCATFDRFVKVAGEMFTSVAALEKLTERFSDVSARIKSVVQ